MEGILFYFLASMDFMYEWNYIIERVCVVDLRRRKQSLADAWRKVQRVIMDRRISRKLKDNAPNSCVKSAREYAGSLDTF